MMQLDQLEHQIILLGLMAVLSLGRNSLSAVRSRWSGRSSVIKAYTRIGLVALSPQKIFDQKVRYRCEWSYTSILYLAQNVVETEGAALSHPFVTNLKLFFKSYYNKMLLALPETFPDKGVSDALVRALTTGTTGFSLLILLVRQSSVKQKDDSDEKRAK